MKRFSPSHRADAPESNILHCHARNCLGDVDQPVNAKQSRKPDTETTGCIQSCLNLLAHWNKPPTKPEYMVGSEYEVGEKFYLPE